MTTRPTFRILVVEDNPAWNAALCTMYRRIFDEYGKVDVKSVDNGTDALRILLRERFDLLSCDINLSESQRLKDNDGRAILRMAAEHRRAAAAVVPTAITSDQTLSVVIHDKTEVARLTLDAVLEKYFGDRCQRLDKPPGADPTATTSVWATTFGEKIVRLTQLWPRVRPPYRLSLDGDYFQPVVTIRGEGAESYFVDRAADAMFFYML